VTAAPATASSAAPAVAPAAHLSILTPRANARTGSTVTVHVAVTGAPAATSPRLRYVLDHHRTLLGSARVTLHDLTPGRHGLQVALSGVHAAAVATTFVVRAPVRAAPVARPAPASTTPTVSTAAPTTTPATTRRSTTPAPAPAPAPARPTPTPKPKKSTPAPAPSGGIPQNGGGDGDADNSGGPSDGDGNI
jgi:hypothetical protein